MIKYYIFGANNVGLTYDGTIPNGAIECDESVYLNSDGYTVVNNALIKPTDDELARINKAAAVADAEIKKSQLRATAGDEIEWRQDAAGEGIATDDEIATLAEWKKYRVLLMRVDTSKAPDIEWPPQPAN